MAPPPSLQLGVSFGGDWSGPYGTRASGPIADYLAAWNAGTVKTHTLGIVTHFCYPSFTAAAFTQPFAQVKPWYDAGGYVVMSLQLFPSGGTVAQLLAGAYDANITAIGQAMAPYSARLGCRLGWECTGTWFAWGVPNIGLANYKAAWAYIVPRLRAAGFTGWMDFNCETENGLTPLTVMPDPAFVDVVSIDKYAVNGEPARASDWPYCWTKYQLPAMQASIACAEQYGKPWALPEFSTGYKSGGYGCGDDDYYLTQLPELVRQHDTRYACVFNMNDMSGSTVVNRHEWAIPAQANVSGPFTPDLTNFPKSWAAWQSNVWTTAYLAAAPTPATVSVRQPVRLTQRRPLQRSAVQHIAHRSDPPPAGVTVSGGGLGVMPLGVGPLGD